jgi:hypothetical protein
MKVCEKVVLQDPCGMWQEILRKAAHNFLQDCLKYPVKKMVTGDDTWVFQHDQEAK